MRTDPVIARTLGSGEDFFLLSHSAELEIILTLPGLPDLTSISFTEVYGFMRPAHLNNLRIRNVTYLKNLVGTPVAKVALDRALIPDDFVTAVYGFRITCMENDQPVSVSGNGLALVPMCYANRIVFRRIGVFFEPTRIMIGCVKNSH
jgi:hypothetical protein